MKNDLIATATTGPHQPCWGLKKTALGVCFRIIICIFGLGAVAFSYADSESAPHIVALPAGRKNVEIEMAALESGPGRILVQGLTHGGAVVVRVNGRPPATIELLATNGLKTGHADSAWVTADLMKGQNRIAIEERDGVQIVHVPETSIWFGASSEGGGGLRFSVEFDQLKKLQPECPFTVYHGPTGEEFLYFSGKFDWYYGETYTAEIDGISGDSGENEATLKYCARHQSRGLRMPMQVTLVRSELAGNFSLRVRQVLHAEDSPRWQDNVEFLHVLLNKEYGRDWGDGVPDWTWFRTGSEGNPDAFAGSRTALARMRDWSARTYTFQSSTSKPSKRAVSGAHHTGAAFSMGMVNAVGGWFSKKDIGSCAIVFHSYQADFRKDLRPIHSHCGDGADTHFYVFWGELFSPLRMKKGDEIEIEYSLCFSSAEPQLTDIIDLNEVDLQVFGDETTQRSPLCGWIGNKGVVGLKRTDGSLLLLGMAGAGGRFELPKESIKGVKSVQRLSDAGRNTRAEVKIENGTVQVAPGEFMIIDCGAACRPLHPPEKKPVGE